MLLVELLMLKPLTDIFIYFELALYFNMHTGFSILPQANHISQPQIQSNIVGTLMTNTVYDLISHLSTLKLNTPKHNNSASLFSGILPDLFWTQMRFTF